VCLSVHVRACARVRYVLLWFVCVCEGGGGGVFLDIFIKTLWTVF
jgi:hypothetical protein